MAADGGGGSGGRLELHPTMRLQRLGSIVVIQPVWKGEVAGASLTCDLETGTLALAEHPKVGAGAGVVGFGGSVGGWGWREPCQSLRTATLQPTCYRSVQPHAAGASPPLWLRRRRRRDASLFFILPPPPPPPLLQVDKGYSEVFGVLGMARLEAGPALVVVTAVEEVSVEKISGSSGGATSATTGARVTPHPHLALQLPARLPALLARPVASRPAAACCRFPPALLPRLLLLQAASLRGHPLFRVTGTEVLADTRNGKWKASDHR